MTETTDVAAAGGTAPGRRAAKLAGAALLIAVLTVAARLAGFARTLVFVHLVGDRDLGAIYQSANTVPNIIFEIVAGGALASLVVPMLAGAIARGDRPAVAATTSALLTWVLTLLAPVAVVVAVAAEPVVRLLDPGADARTVAVGADMLRVFAPQLPLYGVGIVLTGVLQAHRRFAWPVLAPLLSSVTVMTAYAGFAVVAGRRPDIAHVGGVGIAVLSVGTTLGVVVLSLCLLVPLRRLRLRLRPTYAFSAQAAGTVRRLAAAGAVTVAAQQLTAGLTIVLANAGDTGTLVQLTLAQTVYLLPWSVLAVPIATSAYPALAEAAARDDPDTYAATLAGATRGLVLLGCLGAAALAALAPPLAWTLASTTSSPARVAAGIAALAPGLLGYALFALLSRALYARGDTRHAAAATVVGWAAVALVSVGLAVALPGGQRLTALALANSAGMLLLGALLIILVARRAGRAAFDGLTRTLVAAVIAAVIACAAGVGVRRLLWGDATPGVAGALGQGMLSGAVVAAAFLGVAYVLDPRDVRPLLARLVRTAARMVGRGRATREVRE
ncbi:murein biosynthesis integral membrane protein MurJ [Planosporangium mesophilum]|uniref:Membrane protein n=1 Tax=Planosporangium mesophilum TaxID=689768 RepID=A0A8J3TCZ7_9ACTN|nr:lipid II flippase MurJ [Planosporangium mesophilum]NJC85378.1 virulence factor MviN [Planosporangium mesophilum]GII23156.1 membrane protein [Planosporangium mesophilum]